jgi:hypothetical protein
MGPGVPHAVMSLQHPGRRPVSAVMSGSHCLNRFSMVESLHGSIRHAFWHDVWSNTTHDDRDFLLARMLTWQGMCMEHKAEWPFTGDNLYSLLVMGVVPYLLLSLPFASHAQTTKKFDENLASWLERYDPHAANTPNAPSTTVDALLSTVRLHMAQVAHRIMSLLSLPEQEELNQFWASAYALFCKEHESRCSYNTSKATSS